MLWGWKYMWLEGHGVTHDPADPHGAASSALTTLRFNTCQTTRCPPTSADPPSAPMHPAVSILADNVVKYHHLLAPLLYNVLAAVANVHTPVQHSLLITTISWLIVWVPTVFWVGIYSNSDRAKRKTSWLAGALLGLSAICDRAACDKQGIWATKVLSARSSIITPV